jgi:putative ABC transport system substrate-binding protein
VDRRGFLTGIGSAMLTAPLAVEAQQAGRIYHLGFLRNGPPPETFLEGLRHGLRELGYVEGQNISIEYGLARNADELHSAAPGW